MGNEVEELARGIFPRGYLVERRSEGAQELTKKLIAERTPVIFQAVFSTDKFLAATDVLVWNETAKTYDLYEIKMSSTEEDLDEDDEGYDENKPKKVNKKKELQYEYDLAFQANVLEMCGVKIHDKYLIRLNKKYVRRGDLDFAENQLFIKENKTEAVEGLMSSAKVEIEQAHEYLSKAEMPSGPCPCYYKGRNSHCTTFTCINPHVPEYSVHDLNRIGNSKKYLRELLDAGILKVEDVPEHEIPKPKKPKEGEKPGKPRKLNQVRVHKSKEPIIDLEGVKRELDALKFPLYFLDYETYPTAIPPFSGYHPYQHIVFQYSLHVLTEEDAKKNFEPKPFECLLFDGDPAERIVESLRSNIGDTGTVISWYKKFENSRNRELAHLVPAQTQFMQKLVARTYDLMDIVENQYYIHHKFYGRSSIKYVLPAIYPDDKDLSYKTLGVKNGTEAIEAYRQITTGELIGANAEAKKREMLEYCRLDTYAMYKLWRFFENVTKGI